MQSARQRLGQLLVDARIITAEGLAEALDRQKIDGRRLGTLLVELGLVNETQLTQILSQQLNAPWVSLHHIDFSRQLLNLVPREIAERFCLIPIYVRHVRGQGDTLYVAMDDPSNDDALRACAASAGLPARAMIAPPTDIRRAIQLYYGQGRPSIPSLARGTLPSISQLELPPPEPPPPNSVIPPSRDAARRPAPTIDDPELSAHVVADVPPASRGSSPLSEAAATYAAFTEPVTRPAVPSAPELSEDDEIPEITVTNETTVRPRSTAAGARKLISVTLLDGTTISVPTKSRRARRAGSPEEGEESADGQLSVRDIIAALRAAAHGVDASEVLGENARWEAMFAALLGLLVKKHLITDREFIEEFKKI